jgi:large subunit ribosomal protein L15
MKLHELHPAPGAHRPRKRVARGIRGKGGKTAGRGMKGQGARDTIPPGFEGGQLPLMQRIPKLKGFTNPFRIEYAPVNLHTLQNFAGDVATPETLANVGLVKRGAFVKVLARGEIHRSIRVEAHAFSVAARQAIEQAGGTAEVLPAPYGGRRPPAKGNALTNR